LATAHCPDCGSVIEVPDDAEKGEVLSCPCCGLELEVVDAGSAEVRELTIEGEDWGE